MLACAKVNLFLHITGKRQDGYHLLQSLVMFADAGDEIRLQPADAFSLGILGEYADDLSQEDVAKNLVARAAFALAEDAGKACDVAIILQKNIPIGAGLGGGSADAAATLHALNAHWNLGYSVEKLAAIGAHLGADIPACVYNKPLLMKAIGEKITPIEIVFDLPILLVNPRFHVATPDVFRAYMPPFDVVIEMPKQFESPEVLLDFLATMHNALQTPAMAIAPQIKVLLDELQLLPNARLARMSGSGATCFALFDTVEACNIAAEIIMAAYPDYWIQAARLKGNKIHG